MHTAIAVMAKFLMHTAIAVMAVGKYQPCISTE
jgi:hypothetical protein